VAASHQPTSGKVARDDLSPLSSPISSGISHGREQGLVTSDSGERRPLQEAPVVADPSGLRCLTSLQATPSSTWGTSTIPSLGPSLSPTCLPMLQDPFSIAPSSYLL
jgi:hypothetical protein